MHKTSSRLNEISSFRELFEMISCKMLERAAFFVLILCMSSPLTALIHKRLQKGWTFYMTTRKVDLITLVFGIIILIVCAVKRLYDGDGVKKILSKNLTLCIFMLLTALMLISTAVNGVTLYVTEGDQYRGETLLSFVTYLLFYFGLASVIESDRLKQRLADVFLVCSSVIAVIAMLDHVGVISVYEFHYVQTEGTMCAHFYQYNHYAYYINMGAALSGMVWLFMWGRKICYAYLAAFILHVVTLVANGTRGSYIACAAAMVFALIAVKLAFPDYFKRALLMCAVFALSTFIGSFFSSRTIDNYTQLGKDVTNIVSNSDSDEAADAGTQRWLLWKTTFESISEKPLFGWGLEGIHDRLADVSGGVDRPHNEYLQYTAFFGIPAGLCYLAGLLSVIIKAVRQRKTLSPMRLAALTAAFAYMLSACFGNTMPYTTPFFFVFLGLGLRSDKSAENT